MPSAVCVKRNFKNFSTEKVSPTMFVIQNCLMRNLQPIVRDAFVRIIENDPNIWAKCVNHVKRIEDDYALRFANAVALPANGDSRYIVTLDTDADDEMSDTQ